MLLLVLVVCESTLFLDRSSSLSGPTMRNDRKENVRRLWSSLADRPASKEIPGHGLPMQRGYVYPVIQRSSGTTVYLRTTSCACPFLHCSSSRPLAAISDSIHLSGALCMCGLLLPTDRLPAAAATMGLCCAHSTAQMSGPTAACPSSFRVSSEASSFDHVPSRKVNHASKQASSQASLPSNRGAAKARFSHV